MSETPKKHNFNVITTGWKNFILHLVAVTVSSFVLFNLIFYQVSLTKGAWARDQQAFIEDTGALPLDQLRRVTDRTVSNADDITRLQDRMDAYTLQQQNIMSAISTMNSFFEAKLEVTPKDMEKTLEKQKAEILAELLKLMNQHESIENIQNNDK